VIWIVRGRGGQASEVEGLAPLSAGPGWRYYYRFNYTNRRTLFTKIHW